MPRGYQPCLFLELNYVLNLWSTISSLFNFKAMATNGKLGDSRRHGAVKDRSETFNREKEQWVKGAAQTGKFMDVKQDGLSFKRIMEEKG